jgi:3-hydroxyacyl-[acyl-carrier-protein] dehydratase
MTEIHNSIPHRPPFLFIDEIVERRDNGIHCRRTMRREEKFYDGHYPDNPITPGVLLCESVFQAAGIFLNWKFPAGDRVPVLCRIENARFRQMVFPGDTIDIEVTFLEKLHDFYFLTGKVTNAGKVALAVKFALTLVTPAHTEERS